MQFLYVGFFAFLITAVRALRLDIHGQRRIRDSRIVRRGVTGSELNNTADVSYYVDISLGGKSFQLLLDTGSSDLWVAASVPNSKSTPYRSGVNYAVGSVEGPVKTSDLVFAGHTIPDQAFLQITPDLDNSEGDGILGLGPNYGSNIFQEIGTEAGAAVVDRIFLQNQTTPNYLTVLLGRSDDPTDLYSGSLTIGEVLDGFEDVMEQPKLPVIDVPTIQRGDQHFQVLLDEDGLIGPDGKAIPLRTDVATTLNKKLATAVVDTGFSLPQLPKSAAASIYGRFHGAELVDVISIGEVWILPCIQEVNITFKFGGKRYPIHPLDATLDPRSIGISNVMNSKGQDSCIGTFQPLSYDTGFSPNYDMVLGMAFLRNVYVLMDYGDFILGSTEKDDPYMQFLSLTDPAEAHADFVKVRLGGIDTTGDRGLLENSRSSPSHAVYYIIAAVIVVIILICVGGFLIYRARKNRARKPGVPIQHPAPQMGPYVTASLPQYSTPPGVSSPPTSYNPYSTSPISPISPYSSQPPMYPHYLSPYDRPQATPS